MDKMLGENKNHLYSFCIYFRILDVIILVCVEYNLPPKA